ncbi:hypothetical protein HNR56_003091 [Roseospira marina]|nr:hypothetical protein [Roseospira marina]MBB5088383.1 hypothetical protein [Roseospira marina]
METNTVTETRRIEETPSDKAFALEGNLTNKQVAVSNWTRLVWGLDPDGEEVQILYGPFEPAVVVR